VNRGTSECARDTDGGTSGRVWDGNIVNPGVSGCVSDVNPAGGGHFDCKINIVIVKYVFHHSGPNNSIQKINIIITNCAFHRSIPNKLIQKNVRPYRKLRISP
jgi:hypothetical protein